MAMPNAERKYARRLVKHKDGKDIHLCGKDARNLNEFLLMILRLCFRTIIRLISSSLVCHILASSTRCMYINTGREIIINN